MTILLTDDQASAVKDALERNFLHKYPLETRKAIDLGYAALAILDGAQRVEVVDANTDLEPQQELYAVKETK